MKKLILLELALLFLATTFQSHNPPGWYQQTLPVNDNINDIFFLDSLNGWVVTQGSFSSNDTSHILHTSDGGNNWDFQFSGLTNLLSIQFLNFDTGYVCGGNNGSVIMTILKTTNGGIDWLNINNLIGTGRNVDFINTQTGWISSSDIDFGGIWKTTNGGTNWLKQLSPPITPTLSIKALSILNQDTGWAINSSSTLKQLYRTTNGGTNWNVQYTFGEQLNDVLFLNRDLGFISGGVNKRTTDGGFNWTSSTSNVGGIKLSIISDSINWAGADFNKISKTTDNGISWFYQSSPNFDNSSISMENAILGWAAGTGIVKTINGGITSIKNNFIEDSRIFLLDQNYPNPFNPNTIISYELRITGDVRLSVVNINGKTVKQLINKRQSEGNYSVEFDGSGLNSGIYFYRIEISNEKNNEVFSQTKKMLLVK